MQEACKSSSKRQSHSVLPQRGNINCVCTSNMVLSWSCCSHERMMEMYLFSWYQREVLALMNTISWRCYPAIVAALHANAWFVALFSEKICHFPHNRTTCFQVPEMSKCEWKYLLTAEWIQGKRNTKTLRAPSCKSSGSCRLLPSLLFLTCKHQKTLCSGLTV